MLLDGEQRLDPAPLSFGEQVGAGVQGPPSGVPRVVLEAAVPVQVLLDPAAAGVQGVAGEADDVEGIHHRDRVGQLFGGGGPEPGEPVHRDDLHVVAPGRWTLREPAGERVLEAAGDHVQQPCWAGAVPDRGQVDDHTARSRPRTASADTARCGSACSRS